MRLDELPDLIPQWAEVLFENEAPSIALPRHEHLLSDRGHPDYYEADANCEKHGSCGVGSQ